jgi:hypothetical protein
MSCRRVVLDRGLLAAVAIVLCLTSSAALGQVPPPPRTAAQSADLLAFEQLDGNEDGFLSGKEASTVLAYDANGDKRVTKAEFLAARAAARAVDPVVEDNKKFAQLDGNEDGFLSGKEMKGLERFDADTDAELTKDEFLAGRAVERDAPAAIPASFDSFLISVARHDAKHMLAQMHEELRKKVDEPILQFFLDEIHTELGALSDDEPTEEEQVTQDADGTPVTTTRATLAFERGEATGELSIQDSQIVAFSIDSDKVTDLNRKLGERMAGDQAFAKQIGDFYAPRCEPMITLIFAGKDEEVHAILHPEIQKQVTLDVVQTESQAARTVNGALETIEYDGFTEVFDAESGEFKKITVNYKLACENGPVDAKVIIEFVGLSGAVVGFSVTQQTDDTPLPPAVETTDVYRNEIDKLPPRHAENFVPFSFSFPDSWVLDAEAGTEESPNTVKVMRDIPIGDGLEFTQENFAVGSCQVTGSGELAKLGLQLLSQQFQAAIADGFPEYKLNREGDMKFGKYQGYGFDFTSKLPHPKKGEVDCWGRVILIAPSTIEQEHGLSLIMLATSEAPELKGLADLGVKGQLPAIIKSFKVGTEEDAPAPPVPAPPVPAPRVPAPPEPAPPAPPEAPESKSAAAAHYDRAVELADKGDLDGAIAALTEAIELEPRNVDGYIARGNTRYENKDLAGAAADYTLAIKVDPVNVVAHNNRGVMRYYLDDLKNAMMDYEQAIKLDPEYGLAYSNRGLVKLLRFQDADAQRDFDKALELSPEPEFAAQQAEDIREAKLRRAKAVPPPKP